MFNIEDFNVCMIVNGYGVAATNSKLYQSLVISFKE